MTGSRRAGAEPTGEGEDAVRRWLAAPAPVRPDRAPEWLRELTRRAAGAPAGTFSGNDPPADGAGERQAAVLVLLGRGADGPDVLLQQRSRGLRTHAGEVSFPGGRREPSDPDPVATALREAVEETGLDPGGVTPLVVLPRLLIRPSGYEVTGVLAHWRRPSPVAPADVAETATVFRLPLATLAEPRHQVHYRTTGWDGPAFRVGETFVWGYTGEVLHAVLRLGGFGAS